MTEPVDNNIIQSQNPFQRRLIMKRNVLVSLMLLSLWAVVGIIGCGDDSATGSGNLVVDSTNFIVVDDILGDGYFSSAFESMELSFALLDSIPVQAAPRKALFSSFAASSDSIVISSISQYTFSNGWHIFDFDGTTYDPTTQITSAVTGVDSIQVIEDGIAVQYPQGEEFIDGLKLRAHVLWQTDPVQNTGSFHHSLDIEFVRTDLSTTIIISGSATDTVHASFAEFGIDCALDASMDQTITSLTTTTGEQCPTAGTVDMSASIDFACTDTANIGSSIDSLTISSQWHITATVNDDSSVTVHYSDNTSQWTVTEPCDQPLAAAQRWWTREYK